jgi:serine/threonine-protein kinase
MVPLVTMPDAALAATQSLPFSIGSVLADRYEIEALLGEGGMGAVFRAHDRELEEHVALKVLHIEAANDPATLTRFRREVKLARRVTHRNVARTFDLGSHEGLRFLTMEFIAGESLGAHARKGLHLPEVLRIAAEIARGLCAAHVVGVVHRDLKPDNVMLSDDRVVLTDFGIARVADGSADVMRTGMIVGTPAYMAPEQLENQAIDGRTDVYALGTMLFELLARRLPFTGESAMSLAAQRITGDAPDLRSVNASMPDGIATLVHEMLARRREARPDAQAVLDRVEAMRGNVAGAHPGGSALRFATLTSESLVLLGQPRTVIIEPLVFGPETAQLGPLLTSAVVDALAEAHVQVVLAAGGQADLVVQGTLHASGDRVRARLRLVGRKGTPVWAGHVDGTLASSLDFEDAVVDAVTDAIRSQTARDPGPRDPSLREAYEKAQAHVAAFVLPRLQAAIAILEDIEAKHPGDPRVRTLLAGAIFGAWAQMGARDRAGLARAEELALRALDVDATLAGAHHLIAQVRLMDGELAAALRANEECLRHDPRNAEAHEAIGSLMCQALHVSEGKRRLELAARIHPTGTSIVLSRITVYALIGERERARTLLADLATSGGVPATILPMTRLAAWWDDRELAARAAHLIDETKSGAAWDVAAGMMRSIAEGKFAPEATQIFAELTASTVALRRRAAMHLIAADYFAVMGEGEQALGHIVATSRLPFTDLLWLDACPSLARVRNDPRFAEARALTAARCAELWGRVGEWSAGAAD